jgi:organic radical activating enzyme
MLRNTLVTLSLLFTTTLHALDEVKTQTHSTIATYDRAIVTQSNAYYNIYLLGGDPKTMKALQELNQKIEEVLQKILTEEDATLLQELQNRLRSYEKKKNTVKKVLKTKQYKKNKGLLDQFISDQYKGQYHVIIPRKFLYGGNYYGKVIVNGEKIDITEKVISDLEQAIQRVD